MIYNTRNLIEYIHLIRYSVADNLIFFIKLSIRFVTNSFFFNFTILFHHICAYGQKLINYCLESIVCSNGGLAILLPVTLGIRCQYFSTRFSSGLNFNPGLSNKKMTTTMHNINHI